MKIIIGGCGKVGYTLAEQLNEEGHELVLIDTNAQIVQDVANTLDVMGIIGSITSYHVQKEAGIEEADLFIAVTDRDEINLLACLIAKKTGNCETIARVREPEYSGEIPYFKDELGLAMTINPEANAAEEIMHLIQFPSVQDIDTFSRGKVLLIKVSIADGSILADTKLMDLSSRIGFRTLICIVERNHEAIIPTGNFVLRAGDSICFMSTAQSLSKDLPRMGFLRHPIRNVMIAGGGNIAFYLAEQLLREKREVKIIESNYSRCVELSELLPKAIIIHGDATEQSFLKEHGLQETDCLVTLTGVDEENLVLALYANKISKAKVITKIQRINFHEIVSDLPIGSVICPKDMTAERILRFVRSKQHSMGSNVERLYRMMDNQVEALEFIVTDTSPVVNTPLAQLPLRPNLLLCCIFRNGAVISPTGTDCILPGDHVILVTTHKGLQSIDDIIDPES